MERVAFLRAGYVTFALSFAAFAGSAVLGWLVFAGILLAFVGAVLFALSGDDLPRWSGLSLLLYFVVTVLAFLAATPITVRLDFFSGFINDDPSPVASAVFDLLVLALPIMVSAAASAAAWERENSPRLLLAGALAGFVLVAALTFVLAPSGEPEAGAAAVAQTQGRLLLGLFAMSAAAGAAGAVWCAARPDEYA